MANEELKARQGVMWGARAFERRLSTIEWESGQAMWEFMSASICS